MLHELEWQVDEPSRGEQVAEFGNGRFTVFRGPAFDDSRKVSYRFWDAGYLKGGTNIFNTTDELAAQCWVYKLTSEGNTNEHE